MPDYRSKIADHPTLLTPHGTGTFQSIISRSLTRADEKGSGDNDIGLVYRFVESEIVGNRYPEVLAINVPNTIRRLDHSRTYTLDDIVATSLTREGATKKWRVMH